jgi:hypothetical protein
LDLEVAGEHGSEETIMLTTGKMVGFVLKQDYDGARAFVVNWLAERGVVTEKYAWVQDKERGIWTTPGGDKVAWFKDPDGNVLSVSQHC